MLFDSARSAEPPQSSGIILANAFRTFPEAARVETSVPASNSPMAESKSGSWPLSIRSKSLAFSGLFFLQSWRSISHLVRILSVRSLKLRVYSMTASETSKCFSGSNPRAVFRPATSSAPKAEPWIFPVFCFFGEGQPIIVRMVIKDGLSVTDLACSIALKSSCRSSSYFPVLRQLTT